MGTTGIEGALRTSRPEAGDLRAATARLADRADAERLLDVGVGHLDSPIGSLFVAATNAGVVRIGLATEPEDELLDELAEEISPRVLSAPRRVDRARRELDEYFAGARRDFDVPLDWSLARAFRREVLEELVKVPYGETTTYAELAADAGRPRAVRAAGTALATNPIPIIVPCHRVLRSDGSVGGYRGGADVKRKLLALEGGSGTMS
jgi:methylated-DNA-[protein]-cysteine S-methyltransferase